MRRTGVLDSGGAGMALADQSLVSGCNFVTMLILARYLQPESFAHFSLALLVCLLVSNAHWAGFIQPMNVLGASESQAQLSSRLRAVLLAHWVTVPAGSLILLSLAPMFFPEISIVLPAMFYLGCSSLQEAVRRYWYTNKRVGLALRNDLVGYGGQVAGLLILLFAGVLDAGSAFLMLGFTSLLAFLLGHRAIQFVRTSAAHSTITLLQQHWPLSKWLLPTVAAVWGSANIFPFLMAPLGAAPIASFIACRNALQVLGPLIQSVSNYLPVVVSRIHGRDGLVGVRAHLSRVWVAALGVGLTFLLLAQLFAAPLLALLYGGRFEEAEGVFKILSIGATCSFMGAIFGAYALALRDSRSNFLSNANAMLLACTAGPILIEGWGLTGAAWGAAAGAALAFLLQAYFVILRVMPVPRLARR